MHAGQAAVQRGKEAVSEAPNAVRNISRREKLVMLNVIVAHMAGETPPASSREPLKNSPSRMVSG